MQYCPLFREKAGRAKSFLRNSVSLVAVARITLSATIPKTARAVVCKQAYTTALSIFTILADSCYSRKKSKPKFCSLLNPKTIADTNTLQNIYIPPKSPFGKGGLGRFAPGATIKRVSWLTQYS
ncbi:MAG: hypothetical protein IJB23_00760 [Alistipes sp.]|nr:hypothetical protein [Alistipes sp.]